MKRGYAAAASGLVHYLAVGEQGPIVLLIHGAPLSSWIFSRVVPIIGARTRAIAIDVPGCGGSDPLAGPTSIAAVASAVAEAVEGLVPAVEDVVIAGLDTGASVAVELAAAKWQGRVSHLVLTGIPQFAPAVAEKILDRIVMPQLDADGAHLAGLWRRRVANWGADDLEMIRAGFVEHIRQYGITDAVFAPSFAYDHTSALGRLNVPTLVINGESDSMTGSDRDIAMSHAMPFIAVPDCSGQVPYRVPNVYAEALLDFIGA